MDFSILDGTGKGYRQKVDSSGRAQVDSVTRTQSQAAILSGDGYNLATGAINLTNANESALFYLKNNEEFPLVIKEIIFIVGASIGGTTTATATIKRNATDGTIVDNAIAIDSESNRNFSSAKLLTADIYKGAQGYTTTGGTTFAASNRSNFSGTINFDADIIVLEKGNSIACSFTPATSNTSQDVNIAITCFLDKGFDG